MKDLWDLKDLTVNDVQPISDKQTTTPDPFTECIEKAARTWTMSDTQRAS